ncbi:MAG: efflux RND transporter periplasmic adaptor subunit [Minicystis sp.]
MVDPSASMDAPGRAAENAAPRPPAKGAPAAGKSRGLEAELSKVDSGRWLRRLVIVGVLAALIGAGWLYRSKTQPPPPSRYVLGQTSQGDVYETVQSTGQVQPLLQVQVGAQVSGRITKVMVDFNSKVKAGDVLAEIDPTLFGAQIDGNRAQLNAAQATVTKADSNIATSKLRVERLRKLVAEGIGSQSDLDNAQGAYDVSIADAAAARAQIAQIQAALRTSRTNLEYTRIYSPIEGVVINRAIDPGQVVAASFQAPVLFVIAQDLRKMKVLADIDEADVGRLREGIVAEVSVDAFPGEKFKGLVSQLRYSPTSQSGVVTYPAVIEVENPEVKLRPGMTATVSIRSSEVKDQMRLPNAALRFKPTPPVDKDGKKIPQDPLPPLGQHKGRIYVVTDTTPGAEKAEPREVEIGITDGINTVLKTDLTGQKIVVDETDDPKKDRKVF